VAYRPKNHIMTVNARCWRRLLAHSCDEQHYMEETSAAGAAVAAVGCEALCCSWVTRKWLCSLSRHFCTAHTNAAPACQLSSTTLEISEGVSARSAAPG
jgi:hypothetical protein